MPEPIRHVTHTHTPTQTHVQDLTEILVKTEPTQRKDEMVKFFSDRGLVDTEVALHISLEAMRNAGMGLLRAIQSAETRLASGELPPRLTAADLEFQAKLPEFVTTADLEGANDTLVGQTRLDNALGFGLEMPGAGYNIAVTDLKGDLSKQALIDEVRAAAAARPAPPDLVYVHNFDNPKAPCALNLPSGKGHAFAAAMGRVNEFLHQEFSSAVKNAMGAEDSHKKAVKAAIEKLTAAGADLGMIPSVTFNGEGSPEMDLHPMVDGRAMTPEEFEALSPDAMRALGMAQEALRGGAFAAFEAEVAEIMSAATATMEATRESAAAAAIGPVLARAAREVDDPQVTDFLQRLEADIVANAGVIAATLGQGAKGYEAHTVNLLPNDSEGNAPVVIETDPTHENLFGRIDGEISAAGFAVNASSIVAGSLARANGGYLVVDLADAVTEPGVWKSLKRALETQSSKVGAAPPDGRPQMLSPQAAPVDVKVIALLSGGEHAQLSHADADFKGLFKVHGAMRRWFEHDETYGMAYAERIAAVCDKQGLPPFARDAVARIMEFGARQAGSRDKLAKVDARLTDLVRESAFWAKKSDPSCAVVTAEHVNKALQDRLHRANQIDELSMDRYADGSMKVETEGERIGQLNGLWVMQAGDHAFGRPGRITVTTAMGEEGVTSIDRKAGLAGSSHDKGEAIEAGYLAQMYGQSVPLKFVASMVFEQSHTPIDGDSATCAEMIALLSQLSNMPVRQDVAITGAMDQFGRAEPIGGVTEKVEGFFDVCDARGLTGAQGVLIPEDNVEDLMLGLRPDILAAIREGRFFIQPFSSLDQALSVMTGEPAEAVHERVQLELHRLAGRGGR